MKITLEMDNGVYGVFTQNQNKNISLVDQFRMLFDTWYLKYLYKHDYGPEQGGLQEFSDILEHENVGLHHLSHAIKDFG